MSFWGATVITNLLSALPYFGQSLVLWLWGGFSVDCATLARFYSFHFLLPFLLTAASMAHLSLLHLSGSNNPLGISAKSDIVPFHCFFVYKDIFGFTCILFPFMLVCLVWPSIFMESDNFIPANMLVTPVHIVPE